ncbi:MAG TPA: NAD(P)-dependent oxidoreductase [Ornithinimicrobium sp.]|uniref:NAD-dependent epimerase/dehydratase family protein n=1 Tax=Ornithinimicrobium sp. TaxID=1977084 RepID=UPI002B4AA4FE|nr:NAD(P)-dependent oxidoreductase [Ornithinimicrobium sp.]HKJ11368.1 NAD(P)-dependent oxidoreductase [Ornithinimicrobium sp.]
MSIVVTGGSGFLGRTLVRTALAQHQRVVVMDRRRWPESGAPPAGMTMLTGELTAPTDAMRAALREAEAVVHLAGCPGVRDAGPDVAFRRQRDNVDAARSVLAATPLATPTVVLSSSSVYGGLPAGPTGPPGHRTLREDDPLRPRGGYARSKVATERVCAERAAVGGHALVVRPFTVLGEGQRADMAVSRWAHEARSTGHVTVLGSPERTRDLTDVREVARCLTALVASGRVGTVNLGTGQGHTLAQLATAVCAAVGIPTQLRTVPAAHSEVEHTAADTTRLRDWTGRVPVTHLADAVARAVASLPSTRVAA